MLHYCQARDEAIARGEDPDLAEAMLLNGGAAPMQRATTVTAPEPAYEPPRSTGLEAGSGLNLSAQVEAEDCNDSAEWRDMSISVDFFFNVFEVAHLWRLLLFAVGDVA